MADTNLPGINSSTPIAKASYQGGEAVPTPGTPEYAEAQRLAAAANAAKPDQTAVTNPQAAADSTAKLSSNPDGMNSDLFAGLLGSIGEKMKYNNDIATTRQTLLKHLFDSPLKPDEISKLPKDIQDLVNSGNKDGIELQVRVLNDQLQGRAGTLGQTVQALTTGYKQSVDNTKNAMTQILAYAQATGRPIADVVKALAPIYGVDVTNDLMKNLEKLGAPLLKTTQVANDYSYGSATSNVSAALGVMPTLPLSSVIEESGMDAIVDAIIKNEGSSPKGVMNNPGNIKYTGMPGQIDSGVKASDGGSFASYATAEDGRAAIASIVQNAADSKSAAYGPNPTLGDFMDKYTNTGLSKEEKFLASAAYPSDDTKNSPLNNLGGVTPLAIYNDAIDFAFTGKSIQSYTGGLSNSAAVSKYKNIVKNKSGAILDSLGLTRPEAAALYKANASAAKQSVERVARIESISEAMTLNFPRLQDLADKVKAAGIDLTESDVQAGQAAALRKFGNADAAALIELVQTIRSDYASTQAALAGSRGGQFFAENAQDAIPLGLSSDQYQAIKDTIVLSSENARKAIDNEVQSLLGVASGGSASTVSVKLKDPKSGEIRTFEDLTPDELKDALSQGYIQEQ